jgi:hypothetical protein
MTGPSIHQTKPTKPKPQTHHPPANQAARKTNQITQAKSEQPSQKRHLLSASTTKQTVTGKTKLTRKRQVDTSTALSFT